MDLINISSNILISNFLPRFDFDENFSDFYNL